MAGQTIILRGPEQKKLAHLLIDKAPLNAILNIREYKRTLEQNAKMWSMLSDISRAKPRGLVYTTDTWKAIFMNACNHEIEFINGLDGEPFPLGFKSSDLTVPQMSDLITFLYKTGDEWGIQWSEV